MRLVQSIFLCSFLFLIPISCTDEMIENVGKIALPGVMGEGNSGTGLSTTELIRGLKSALSVGSSNASKSLNVTDAYFRNELIKIAFPPQAAKVASTLNDIGMGHLVTKATKSLNRAAEHAAIKAKPVFISAITQMTINDAWAIFRGTDNAATKYLQRTTSSELTKAFRPVISNSLNKVDATRYWGDIMNNYNQIPFIQKINPDLTGYVTGKALDGLFFTVAGEEKKIRKNPAKRVNEILRKVFSYKG